MRLRAPTCFLVYQTDPRYVSELQTSERGVKTQIVLKKPEPLVPSSQNLTATSTHDKIKGRRRRRRRDVCLDSDDVRHDSKQKSQSSCSSGFILLVLLIFISQLLSCY